jgi:hypothetical protein
MYLFFEFQYVYAISMELFNLELIAVHLPHACTMDDGIHNGMNYRSLKEMFVLQLVARKCGILLVSVSITDYQIVTALLLMKMECKLLHLNFDCNFHNRK